MIFQGENLVFTAEDALVLSEATRGPDGWARLSARQRERFEEIISELWSVRVNLTH